MLKKLLSLLGRRSQSPAEAKPPYAPYADSAANFIYNLVFCDNPDLFRTQDGGEPSPWRAPLFGEPPDLDAIRNLAADIEAEGRIRYLAYSRLRTLSEQVERGILLGVIVEVPVNQGLDTLAAFSEGGVRYINYTGRIVVKETPIKDIDEVIEKLMAASQKVVDHHGPWNYSRWPPPTRGRIRLSFLVSDGLYCGDGPEIDLQGDPTAGPVIQQATELMIKVTKLAVKPGGADWIG